MAGATGLEPAANLGGFTYPNGVQSTYSYDTLNRPVPDGRSESDAYSGEIDQGSGAMPISDPVDSDQVIGAERRWRVIVYEVIGIVNKKLREIKSERVSERSDADEML